MKPAAHVLQQFNNPPPKHDAEITPQLKEKAQFIKQYIECKYKKLKQEEAIKTEAWEKVKIEMAKLGLAKEEQELITKEILHREAELNRKWRSKVTVQDFDSIAIIGKGAFGEVRVVRSKKTGEVFAMKKMKKKEMIAKNQLMHVKAERDVLTKSNNTWIVDLQSSFQDEDHLYLVMEYLPGGDLMTLLIRKETLTEAETRFYISEIVSAIETVHKLNYIHRDLKPDNVLIDKAGHIKLSDFGLCKHAEIQSMNGDTLLKKQELGIPINPKTAQDKKAAFRRNRQLAFSTVGTPDYIAPEVFGQEGYSETVDWWSVGVILFEMLVGYPPFFSDEPSITCQKIMHWRKTLVIPSDAKLSPSAYDLIKRLICDADHRLGKNGVEEIKSHSFFEGVNWHNLKNCKSPNIPDLKSEIDTSNFDKFDESKSDPFISKTKKKGKKNKVDINFIGYTFQKDFENEKNVIMKAFQDPQVLKALQIEITSQLSNLKSNNTENHLPLKKQTDSKNPILPSTNKPVISNSEHPLIKKTDNKFISNQPTYNISRNQTPVKSQTTGKINQTLAIANLNAHKIQFKPGQNILQSKPLLLKKFAEAKPI
jgi:serine/threonine kinase 38